MVHQLCPVDEQKSSNGGAGLCAPQVSGYEGCISTGSLKDYDKLAWDAQLRTSVVRAPNWTSRRLVVQSFKEQYCEAAGDKICNLVEEVYRDELDDGRFFIRFSSLRNRQLITAGDFKFGTTNIPKDPTIFSGMISEVPPGIPIEIMKLALQTFGELHDISFAKFSDTSMATRRLFFSYREVNNQIPETIVLDGIRLTVHDLRARKHCSQCEKYGHEAFQCTDRDSGVSSDDELAHTSGRTEDTKQTVVEVAPSLLPKKKTKLKESQKPQQTDVDVAPLTSPKNQKPKPKETTEVKVASPMSPQIQQTFPESDGVPEGALRSKKKNKKKSKTKTRNQKDDSVVLSDTETQIKNDGADTPATNHFVIAHMDSTYNQFGDVIPGLDVSINGYTTFEQFHPLISRLTDYVSSNNHKVEALELNNTPSIRVGFPIINEGDNFSLQAVFEPMGLKRELLWLGGDHAEKNRRVEGYVRDRIMGVITAFCMEEVTNNRGAIS